MGKTSKSLDDLAIDDVFDRPGAAPGVPPAPYLDLEVLRNADSLIAIISQRRANGVITFALFKEFERDLRRDRTSFVAAEMGESFRGLLEITLKRIAAIKADPALLEKLQREALKNGPTTTPQRPVRSR